MTITMTATFKDTFKLATVEFIEENCVEGDYELTDAMEFIAEHGEDDFVQFYDDYIEQGEKLGYDVVDAFIKINGIVNTEHCEDAFAGCFNSQADFAEDLFEQLYTLPVEIVVDWQATWDSSLEHDYYFIDGYVFHSNF